MLVGITAWDGFPTRRDLSVYSPHDVLGVTNVMTLCILIPIEQDRHSRYVVEQLTRWQHPQVATGIDAAIAMSSVETKMLSVLPDPPYHGGFSILTPTVTAAFYPAVSYPPVHGGRAGRRCVADHVWLPLWAPPSWCPALCTRHWAAVSHSRVRRGCVGDSCCVVVCHATAPSAAPLWAVWVQRPPPRDANGSVLWASRRSELYRWPSRMCPRRRTRCVAAKSCAPAGREKEGRKC